MRSPMHSVCRNNRFAGRPHEEISQPCSMKPAVVRFYLDADIRGTRVLLAQIRPDLTYPGDPGGVVHKRERPACPIVRPETDDDIWIPQVTSLGSDHRHPRRSVFAEQ